ncbi:MAG TPA: acyl carrier protein [Ignavibacteria bacterium]|nr:acyl carrier protein [Ignavibacteria bacterium]
MISKELINQTIYNAIDEINLQIEGENKLEKKEETTLYGKNSLLDSLGLVNLIVEVEQRFQDEHEVTINLTDEKALSQKNSPFLSVKTLSEYISGLLNK